jgi:hypothetical protein
MESKPFYKSKIVAFCAVLFVWALHQLSVLSEVTPEMIASAEGLGDTTVEIVKNVKGGSQLFTQAVALIAPLIAVFRVWFSNKKIG